MGMELRLEVSLVSLVICELRSHIRSIESMVGVLISFFIQFLCYFSSSSQQGLNEQHIPDRCHGLNSLSTSVDKVAWSRENGGTFKAELLTLLGTTTSSVILNNAIKEVLTALGGLNVLNANVNAFLDDTSADLLINNDTNSAWSHVPDDTSATVIAAVGHTLMDGTIRLDIDEVTNLVSTKIGGEVLGAMRAESASEFGTSSSPETVAVRHCEKL